MNKSPSFQFYPADFLSDERVTLMSLSEIGAYILALSYCWREGSIPANEDQLRTLLKGCSRDVARTVKSCFTPHQEMPSRLIHSRLESEKQKQLAWRAKCSEAGKKGKKPQLNGNSTKVSSTNLEALVQPTFEEPYKVSSTLQSSSSSSSSEDSPSENPKTTTPFVPASPTLGELLHFANNAGYDKREAETWWYQKESFAWKDWKGEPIASWRHALTAHMRRFEDKELAKQNRASNPSRTKSALPPSRPVVPLSDAGEYHDSEQEPPSLLRDFEKLKEKHAAEAEDDHAFEIAED